MSLFRVKPKVFDTSDKPKVQIIVDEIDRFDDDGYTICSGSHASDYDQIDCGYSLTIMGHASSECMEERAKDGCS
jgi:hypothetical protein